MLTVVDELGNDGPRWWQEAAKAVVCEIFNDYSLEKIIHHLDSLEEEWQEMRKNEEKVIHNPKSGLWIKVWIKLSTG